MQLAHAAQRLHGRQDILQKQLQQELVTHTSLMHKVQSLCWQHEMHHTPYEVVVGSSLDRVREHITDVRSLSEQLQAQQEVSENAPHFFRWAGEVGSLAVGDGANSGPQSKQQPECHTMVMPRSFLRYSLEELTEVRLCMRP